MKNEIIKRIKYSDKWNNAKCPEWVYKLIEAVPEQHEEMIIDFIMDGIEARIYAVQRVLVMCKDCIHYEEGKCTRFLCGVYVEKNHFCGWGRRNVD